MNERAPVLALSRDVSAMLKGIAILLVLLGHTGVVRMGGAGGVALFLIVSGYGLHCSWESGGPEGYWRKRAQKVWLPYIFKPDKNGCGLILMDMLNSYAREEFLKILDYTNQKDYII